MFAVRAPVAFDGERFRPDGATVLVEGRRIVGVEPAAYDAPDGCEVRAHPGTVLPGLVDGHVHLVGDSSPTALDKVPGYSEAELDAVVTAALAEQAAAGVTTVRDLGDLGYCTLPRRDRPGPLEPRIAAAGPPLTVPGGHCHFLGGAVGSEDDIRAAVAERVERGVDVVKVMTSGGMLTPGTDVFAPQFDDGSLRCLVDAAHDAGLPVLAHAHALAAMQQAVAAGVDGVEHATCLTPAGIELPDDLLADLVERDVAVCPTMALDPAVGPPPPGSGILAAFARIGLTPQTAMVRRTEVLGRLFEAGVRVVNGVDSGVIPAKRHGNAWRGVLDLIAAGAPVEDALTTATSVSAAACGFGDVTGRLRPGYDADLLVVDGDLRHDPDALGRPTAVVVRGSVLPG